MQLRFVRPARLVLNAVFRFHHHHHQQQQRCAAVASSANETNQTDNSSSSSSYIGPLRIDWYPPLPTLRYVFVFVVVLLNLCHSICVTFVVYNKRSKPSIAYHDYPYAKQLEVSLRSRSIYTKANEQTKTKRNNSWRRRRFRSRSRTCWSRCATTARSAPKSRVISWARARPCAPTWSTWCHWYERTSCVFSLCWFLASTIFFCCCCCCCFW